MSVARARVLLLRDVRPNPADAVVPRGNGRLFQGNCYEVVHLDDTSPDSAFAVTDGSADNKPVNYVNLQTAAVLCWRDGGRLPTAHEWEFAARGGAEQRPWPWGSAAPTFDRLAARCAETLDAACDLADLPDIGSRAAGQGRWGHADLAGSVSEPTADGVFPWLGNVDASIDAPVCDQHELDALCSLDLSWVPFWGGSWMSGSLYEPFLGPAFLVSPQGYESATTGVRCVRD